MARFPELRVTRDGAVISALDWSDGDGDPVALVHMKVLSVATEVLPGELPAVKVTFLARLVEVEAGG